MEHMGPKLCGNLGRRLHQSYTRIVELNTGINMDYPAQNVVNLCNLVFSYFTVLNVIFDDLFKLVSLFLWKT